MKGKEYMGFSSETAMKELLQAVRHTEKVKKAARKPFVSKYVEGPKIIVRSAPATYPRTIGSILASKGQTL